MRRLTNPLIYSAKQYTHIPRANVKVVAACAIQIQECSAGKVSLHQKVGCTELSCNLGDGKVASASS